MFFPVQSCSYRFLSFDVSFGVGLGVRVLRGLFLVSSLVPYGSYVLYAVLSMSMESQVMPVCRSSESISRPSASMSPQ